MAEHGNRSAHHEREIRNIIDTANLENTLEQKHLHKEVENYFEEKAEEKANRHKFDPKATAKEK